MTMEMSGRERRPRRPQQPAAAGGRWGDLVRSDGATTNREAGLTLAVSIFGFAGYILGNGWGAPYTIMFWVVWLGYGALHPRLFGDALRSPVPWIFPIWCLLSAFWSQTAGETGKLAVELLITTLAAVIASRALTARGALLSLFGALLIGGVISLTSGHTEIIYTGNVEASNGVFGSKNNFAMFSAMLMLAGIAVGVDDTSPRWIRLIGAGGVLVAINGLMRAHSTGGTVAGIIGAVVLLALVSIRRLPQTTRIALALAGLILLVVLALGIFLLLDTSVVGAALSGVGKDPTLTGRVYLWARAKETIALHPWLGVGYQAYWRQGLIDAEGLWRYMKVSSRGGVSMHNLYYETTVQVGLIGFVLLAVTLGATLIASLISAVGRPTPLGALSVALTLFLLSRIALETDFLSPFTIGVMLLPLLYTAASLNVRKWLIERRQVPVIGRRRMGRSHA